MMGICCDMGLGHCGWAAVDCCRVIESNISRFYGAECVSGTLHEYQFWPLLLIGIILITIITIWLFSGHNKK